MAAPPTKFRFGGDDTRLPDSDFLVIALAGVALLSRTAARHADERQFNEDLFGARSALFERTTLRSLKEKNSLSACQDQVLTLEEYYDLVGLKPMLAREEACDKAAATLTQKRAAE